MSDPIACDGCGQVVLFDVYHGESGNYCSVDCTYAAGKAEGAREEREAITTYAHELAGHFSDIPSLWEIVKFVSARARAQSEDSDE